ncbi:hypothetical protein J1N35_020335 [Gossypium stocksii]|uniref:Uncharacterized protein n=1 Tax=Gossypium stocksii TaxID=47602 RepID=A0A9D4A1C4_9ROSI|nr:hypothetical protein J1N35_020335 [Gossypium stocksii]
MNMMQRQVGTVIPINIENNPRRDGKEHIKAISLCLDTILENSTVPAPNEVSGRKKQGMYYQLGS